MAEKQPFNNQYPVGAPYPTGTSTEAPPPYVDTPGIPPANYGVPPAQSPYYQQGADQQPYPPGQPQNSPYPPHLQPVSPVAAAGVMPPTTTTTIIYTNQRLGRGPSACVCPNCHQNIVTQVIYDAGLLVWLIAGLIFILGGWICCLCLIPFCINDLKDVRHVCPNCRHQIQFMKAM